MRKIQTIYKYWKCCHFSFYSVVAHKRYLLGFYFSVVRVEAHKINSKRSKSNVIKKRSTNKILSWLVKEYGNKFFGFIGMSRWVQYAVSLYCLFNYTNISLVCCWLLFFPHFFSLFFSDDFNWTTHSNASKYH